MPWQWQDLRISLRDLRAQLACACDGASVSFHVCVSYSFGSWRARRRTSARLYGGTGVPTPVLTVHMSEILHNQRYAPCGIRDGVGLLTRCSHTVVSRTTRTTEHTVPVSRTTLAPGLCHACVTACAEPAMNELQKENRQ